MNSAVRLCPACDGPHADFAFRVRDFDHARCRRCATVFVTPLPDPQALETLYLAPDYHPSAEGQEQRMRPRATRAPPSCAASACVRCSRSAAAPGIF
ncbi:hypothetical protein [Nannocystis punicea]|uniref:Uncharacterized protein n=1 Tax=Nannocystis punicea TaxID=2995304 RepID=A0ABY7H3R2_9BACT|nr:hypothetical protein [Nannocystis poenicansa]WAS93921.1 hypothetical protein O0S08_47925 [Nannocystis poenicansa]